MVGKLGLYRLCHCLSLKKLQEKTLTPWNCRSATTIIIGVGGRKNMWEKLLLAVTITFSLNLFLQVRVPNQTNTGASYQERTEILPQIMVTAMSNK